MSIPYIRSGDYFIPDLKLTEETRPIGKWGRMHRDYLKEHHIETKGGVVIYDVDYALDVTETDKEFIRKHQRSLKSWLNTIPVSVSCDTKCLID